MKINSKVVDTNIILEYIKENEPLCLSDISEKFNISWTTAKTLLLELVLHGKINMKKCGKTWIVWMKEGSKLKNISKK